MSQPQTVAETNLPGRFGLIFTDITTEYFTQPLSVVDSTAGGWRIWGVSLGFAAMKGLVVYKKNKKSKIVSIWDIYIYNMENDSPT